MNCSYEKWDVTILFIPITLTYSLPTHDEVTQTPYPMNLKKNKRWRRDLKLINY